MIAKRILRAKATGRSDFARLGQYILNVKGRQSPETWERTADYILDTQHGGEKVGSIRITHCIAQDPAMAVAEIVRKQERNTRSKTDKTYHLVVSFPPGERPDEKQLHYIEDELCASIGFGDHQRISAVHLDTDHLHIHVAISKIHPQSLSNIEPYFDKRKLMRTCARLEVELGLMRTHEATTVDRERLKMKAAAHRPDALSTESTGAHEPAVGWTVRPGLSPGAEGLEAHAGRVSLLGWAKERVPEATKRAQTWAELHQALASVGLHIKPRGAGLVMGANGHFVKASEVDRALSFDSLTRRLGPYQGTSDVVRKPESPERYRGAPKQPGTQAAALFAEYQQARDAALAHRVTRRGQLREGHQRYTQKFSAWYQAERSRLRADPRLRGRVKLQALKKLSETRRRALKARQQLEKEQRRELTHAAPLPTWQGFLELRSAAGDDRALAALRSRARSPRSPRQDSIRVISPSGATRLRRPPDRVRKNGDREYRSPDGGVVIDTPSALRVQSHSSDRSVLMALTLAQERFSGQRLVVEGSPEFGTHLARVAREQGVTVRFADASLEQLRCAPVMSRSVLAPDALDRYIAERNTLRSRVSNLEFHERWSGAAAGPATYEGRRQLADGSQALLLKRGETMFVMPVTDAYAQRASRRAVGDIVTVDAQGQLMETRKRGARR